MLPDSQVRATRPYNRLFEFAPLVELPFRRSPLMVATGAVVRRPGGVPPLCPDELQATKRSRQRTSMPGREENGIRAEQPSLVRERLK